MGSISKSFSLILILTLAASILIIVKPAFSQTPTPSVPEFTLQYINSTYSVTTTNPYTGVNTTQQIDNSTIDFIIGNQPFTPYSNIQLYYIIQEKGHFGGTWTQVPYTLTQSNSQHTTLLIPTSNYPANSQLDFQVEAAIGHYTTVPYYPHGYDNNGNPIGMPFGTTKVFNGTQSGWSNTQTINLADGSVSISTSPNPTTTTTPRSTSPTNSPTSTPTVPEFPTIEIMLLFILILSPIAIFRVSKQMKQNLNKLNPTCSQS